MTRTDLATVAPLYEAAMWEAKGNKAEAARLLGIGRTTLVERLARMRRARTDERARWCTDFVQRTARALARERFA
jgi:DNA-binding NtrC family response regulator